MFNHAPYGMCDEHNVPLEVLFQAPYCPMCEDQRKEANKDLEKECKKGGCGKPGGCDGGGCGEDEEETTGWAGLSFPWPS